jgi:hypothetical protein
MLPSLTRPAGWILTSRGSLLWASECGTLCRGVGSQRRGNRGRRAVHVTYAPTAV